MTTTTTRGRAAARPRPTPAARPARSPRRPPPADRRRPVPEAGSRERLLRAAAAEFAARGFAGANVDRIAAAARVNKAMLYYHFRSKAGLYQEIVGGMFQAVGARIREVAASGATAEEKLAAFIQTIAAEAEARPHFPPIWLREVAEGGTHLEDSTLRNIAVIVKALVAILQEGVQARRFKPVHPLLVHGGIVGPILLFFATGPLRRRLERLGVKGAAGFGSAEVVAHVQRITLGILEGKL
jgi:AcrR family transcriptional regulator